MISATANELRFPPSPAAAKRLKYPIVPAPRGGVVPSERHTGNLITTIRDGLTVALAPPLKRCRVAKAYDKDILSDIVVMSEN
jgi:hypothetical protein